MIAVPLAVELSGMALVLMKSIAVLAMFRGLLGRGAPVQMVKKRVITTKAITVSTDRILRCW